MLPHCDDANLVGEGRCKQFRSLCLKAEVSIRRCRRMFLLEMGEMLWLSETRSTHLERGSSFILFSSELLQGDVWNWVKLNLPLWTITLFSCNLALLRVLLSTQSCAETINIKRGVCAEVGLLVHWLQAVVLCAVGWLKRTLCLKEVK